MKSRILVIGSVGLDLVCPMENYPSAGQTYFSDGCEMMPGGKALVSAMTFAEMDLEPILCACIGDDAEGQHIKAFCREMGLDTRFLFTARDTATALRIMLTDSVGERRTVRYQGAAASITHEQIEDAFTCLPDAVFLQGEISEELLCLTIQFAENQKIPVFYDPGDVVSSLDFLKNGMFEIVTPSEDEVRSLTSSPLRTQDEIMRACLQVASHIPARYYVIKLGSRGSILYDGTYYHLVTAYDVDAVDTCGAGDIYAGVLVAEYLKNGDIRSAMEYANAGAAISVTRRGSVGSIPHSAEITKVVNDNTEGGR